MVALYSKSNLSLIILASFSLMLCACTQHKSQSLTTIADARNNPAYIIDNGKPGDSAGDVLVFDQPLLDKDMKTIGNNSGSCIRTHVGHSYQCQWTLTFDNEIHNSGTIQVAGRLSILVFLIIRTAHFSEISFLRFALLSFCL